MRPSRRSVRLLLLAISGLLAAGAGAGVVLARPVRYESRATLRIDQPVLAAVVQTPRILLKLIGLRLKYTALIPTSVIVEPVARTVGISPEEVVDAARFANPPNASFITIAARTRDPLRAPRIAEAISNELVKYLKDDQIRQRVPAPLRIHLIPALPTGPAVAVEPNQERARATAAVGALFGVAGAMMALLGTGREPRYHGPADDSPDPDSRPRAQPIVARRLRAKRFVAIASALVVGAAGAWAGAASVLRDPPRYRSNAILLIDQPFLVASAGGEGVLVKLAGLRFKYSALVPTPVIASPVAAALGAPPGIVPATTRVVNPPDSALMFVVSQTGDRAQAPRLADAVASQLITFVKDEHIRERIPDNFRITLTSVATAGPASKVGPDTGSARARGILGGIAGVILGYVLVVAASGLLRRTRSD